MKKNFVIIVYFRVWIIIYVLLIFANLFLTTLIKNYYVTSLLFLVTLILPLIISKFFIKTLRDRIVISSKGIERIFNRNKHYIQWAKIERITIKINDRKRWTDKEFCLCFSDGVECINIYLDNGHVTLRVYKSAFLDHCEVDEIQKEIIDKLFLVENYIR